MTKRFPTDPEILENDTFNVNDDVNKFMRMEFDNKVVSAGTCPKYQRKKVLDIQSQFVKLPMSARWYDENFCPIIVNVENDLFVRSDFCAGNDVGRGGGKLWSLDEAIGTTHSPTNKLLLCKFRYRLLDCTT